MEKIKEWLKERKKIVMMVAGGVFVMIFLVVTVNVIAANDSGFKWLEISNEKEVLLAMPATERKEVKGTIFETLKKDVGVVREGEVVEIVVRDYSETDEELNGIAVKVAKFFVDIEKYQRTYKVTQVWAPGRPNAKISTNGTVTVECPKVSESRYPEAKCWTGWNNYKDKELQDGE